jgi:glycosyltransferase involved in cell wall biosynthesis
MPTLSVAIITLNEEKNIGRCLASVQGLADEVLVVDSLSTDQTRAICMGYGVRFVEQAFLGYIEQKRFAIDLTVGTHVLLLDADEALSPALRKSIEAEKQQGFPAAGYTMNRMSWFCDRWIRHGTWYPDRKLRLARKDLIRISGQNPHDRMELYPENPDSQLRGDLLHYTYYSMDAYVQQGNKFSTIAARAMHEKGQRASAFQMVVNPTIAFIKCYFLKMGFLDGFNGYVIARQSAYQTFLKYMKLRQFSRKPFSDAEPWPDNATQSQEEINA